MSVSKRTLAEVNDITSDGVVTKKEATRLAVTADNEKNPAFAGLVRRVSADGKVDEREMQQLQSAAKDGYFPTAKEEEKASIEAQAEALAEPARKKARTAPSWEEKISSPAQTPGQEKSGLQRGG